MKNINESDLSIVLVFKRLFCNVLTIVSNRTPPPKINDINNGSNWIYFLKLVKRYFLEYGTSKSNHKYACTIILYHHEYRYYRSIIQCTDVHVPLVCGSKYKLCSVPLSETNFLFINRTSCFRNKHVK